ALIKNAGSRPGGGAVAQFSGHILETVRHACPLWRFTAVLTVVRRAVVALVGGVLIAGGSVTPAVAHQQWFVADPQDYPVDGAALLRPGVLLGVVGVVVITFLWRAAASRLPVP